VRYPELRRGLGPAHRMRRVLERVEADAADEPREMDACKFTLSKVRPNADTPPWGERL
jgi:hypothetical protein